MSYRVARSCRVGGRFFLFISLIFGIGLTASFGQQPRPLLGPVEEVSVLDDFTAASKDAWKASAGQNVSFDLQSGRNIPGVASSLMQIALSKREPHDREPGHNWFSLRRELAAGSLANQADGIRLVMGSQPAAQWWINVSLRVGAETYSYVLEPTYPSRALIEHVLPFSQFTASGQALTPAKAAAATAIGLDFSVPDATLFLDRITTFRQESYYSWLSCSTRHPQNNLFQPGQPVSLSFTPGGTLPAKAQAFRFEILDFFEKSVTNGIVHLNGSTNYVLNLEPELPGYYEVRAYWLDSHEQNLENRSCILAEGSMPAGLATFAVMPHTLAHNIDRFKKLNSSAFFGLHGDFLGLADSMGLTWRFDYSTWGALEPQKPDRSHGLAAWARRRIEDEPPRPAYLPHILPLSGNFAAPDWAKPHANKTPPFFDWADYLPMLHDSVEVEKHLHPDLHPRIYGVAWEVNLNMPPDNMGPPYTPADVVELHRRSREVIKTADPESLVIGPCPSNLNPEWMESVFKAGLLEYIDGIESHGYADNGFMPEENGYPIKLSAIKDLMRKYNHGKVLPIYITEAGIRGMLGSKIVYRDQARFITRLAIILKGEGVRVFLPFYGIDYDRDGWWGFCFNLEVDAGNPWMTRRISPKPAVNALATCADLLEGARPLRRVTGFGPPTWAYLFDRGDTEILAIWSSAGSQQISVPADPKSGRVVDIMGRTGKVGRHGERIELTVDESPQYVLGVSAKELP